MKKLIALVLVLVFMVGLFGCSNKEVKMQDLVLMEQGIKITAPEKDVEEYLEAYQSGADSATLEMILNDILSNPECQVQELPDSEK